MNFDILDTETYQAVAVKFDPLNNATWTKCLHGEPASSSSSATLQLLRESEKEITKHFSANGSMVPFERDMVQTSTMGGGQREGSSAKGSPQSDFVFVDIAEPNVADNTVLMDLIEEHPSIQEYPLPESPVVEAVLEPANEVPRAVTPEPGLSWKEPEPASDEAETHNFGWSRLGTSKMGRQNQKTVLTIDLPALVEEYPAEASAEEPPAEVEAYPVECVVEVCPPPEPEPNECIVEEVSVREPEPVEETDLEGDTFSLKKSKKTGKKSNQELLETFDEPIIEVEPAPEFEPAIEDSWGAWGVTAKKSKKKKGGFTFGSLDLVAEASLPPPEPEPVIDDTYFSWGTTNKKSKKKKGGATSEIVDPVAEVLPPSPCPEPEPEPVVEDPWGTGWGAIAKKSKKKKRGTTFESVDSVAEALPPPSEPEPIIEDIWFDWGTTNKKSKKKKVKCLEIHSDPAPEPQLEPVVVDALETPTKKEEKMRSVLKPEPDEWAQFSASKRSEKDEWGEPEVPLGEESSAARKSSAGMLDVPPATEPVQPPDVAILLAQATSTETPTHNTQLSTPRSGQTVVFTIQFPEEVNMKPLQAMITLADNTRAAILEAVHSYIDSKSSLMYTRGLRRLEIKSGAGKNGEVDLSTLEETMWPEYLEYFRQYTKLPELTIDCLHC